MTAVQYDVELIQQVQNPICWVAISCAMVKGWGTQSSVGIGDLGHIRSKTKPPL
jgi:hypothetical protein